MIRPAAPAAPELQPPSRLPHSQAQEHASKRLRSRRSKLLDGAFARHATSFTSALRPVWARLASNPGSAMAPNPGPTVAHSPTPPPKEKTTTTTNPPPPASTSLAGDYDEEEEYDDEEDIIEIPRDDLDGSDVGTHSQQATEQQEPSQKPVPAPAERPKTPAYVAPIPKIGSIPTIPVVDGGGNSSSLDGGITRPPPARRPQLSPQAAELLVGNPVNEDGEVVDPATGAALARVSGDLPDLVGRTVANRHGDIFGDRGEFLGYVAELVEPEQEKEQEKAPRSLVDLLGGGTASLMVDGEGNILDASGSVVGQFHDNNNPVHRKLREGRERGERTDQEQEQTAQQAGPSDGPPSKEAPDGETSAGKNKEPGEENQQQPRPRRTDEERRQNAESWRKEKPGESPSDIFLDVKSTHEGIQLTIRIPTVFNGQQRMPNITFS